VIEAAGYANGENMTGFFKTPPTDKAALEESAELSPRFDAAGLITAVVTDSRRRLGVDACAHERSGASG
jgi:hypothetical protein